MAKLGKNLKKACEFMMEHSLIINPFAEVEIKNARNWYDLQKDNLGEEFLLEIKEIIFRLKENPLQFPIIKIKSEKLL